MLQLGPGSSPRILG